MRCRLAKTGLQCRSPTRVRTHTPSFQRVECLNTQDRQKLRGHVLQQVQVASDLPCRCGVAPFPSVRHPACGRHIAGECRQANRRCDRTPDNVAVRVDQREEAAFYWTSIARNLTRDRSRCVPAKQGPMDGATPWRRSKTEINFFWYTGPKRFNITYCLRRRFG